MQEINPQTTRTKLVRVMARHFREPRGMPLSWKLGKGEESYCHSRKKEHQKQIKTIYTPWNLQVLSCRYRAQVGKGFRLEEAASQV